MQLEFTRNAMARMADRGIQVAALEAALEAPDQLSPCFEKCWHARKAFEGRRLEVVFTRSLTHAVVVTAYWQESA
jgi:hypothetical protein